MKSSIRYKIEKLNTHPRCYSVHRDEVDGRLEMGTHEQIGTELTRSDAKLLVLAYKTIDQIKTQEYSRHRAGGQP